VRVNIFKSKWTVALLIPIIGWLSLSFIKIKLQSDIVNKEVGDLEAKIQDLEDSNSSLDKLIGYLKHPSFLDKEARLKLNYKSAGEEVAFVYSDTNTNPKTSSSSSDSNNQLTNISNYIKWFWYLMGY